VNVSCALDPRSVSPLWCLSAYRSWAAQTSSSSTRALRSMALTTAKTPTPRDARGIRGIFRLSTGQRPSTPARDTVRLLLCCYRIFGQQTALTLIRSVAQQRVYQSRVHDTDELKQCVQQVWRDVDQSIIDDALTSGTSVFVHACSRTVDTSSICCKNNTPISSQLYDNIKVSFLSNTTRFLIFFCCNLQ